MMNPINYSKPEIFGPNGEKILFRKVVDVVPGDVMGILVDKSWVLARVEFVNCPPVYCASPREDFMVEVGFKIYD